MSQPRTVSRAEYLRLRGALYDRVTRLPSVALLVDELRGWLDDRPAVGVLHVEIEALERVEALYGWQVFDEIVARTAAELRAAVGSELPAGTRLGIRGVATASFAGFVRAGPDEADVDEARCRELGRALARRLDRMFDEPQYRGLNPPLRGRVGHALLSLDPFFRFERRVTAALEHARALPGRRARRGERALAGEFGRILREEAVCPVFQPVVDLRSGAILGWEALARGPQDGPLEHPGALFAASERLGRTFELDRACARAALRDAAALEAPGSLFVNVLPQSVTASPDTVAWWADAATSTPGGSRREVVLEFSERSAARAPGTIVVASERARRSGCRVALDDVGTSGAGQALVEEVRPDYVKLDGSLVRGIAGDRIKREILRSVVRIADSIGASVIAEGVEARDEAAVLVEAGARYGQGYLFARPAPRAAGRPASPPGDVAT